MELRQIRHFIAIVEEKNFALAARRACISQPALSRSLRMLEADLQTRLIERGPRRSVPTASGERFLPHARAILADCERARSAVNVSDTHSTRLLTIGVAAPLSDWFAFRIATRLALELPQARVCFKESPPEDLAGLIRAASISFAITTRSGDAMDPGVVTEALAPLHSVVVGPQEAEPFHLSRNAARALLPTRWVTLDGLDDHLSLHEHFRQSGLGNPCVMLTGSLARLRSLVTESGRTALVPPQLLDAELNRGDLRVLEVDIPQRARSVGILHLDDTPCLPLMERIKAIVRECWSEARTPVFAALGPSATSSSLSCS